VALAASYFVFKGRLGSSTASNTNSTVASSPSSAASSLPSTTNVAAPGKFDLISSANPELYKTLAQIPNVPEGTFNYGGSTTFAPLRSESVT